MTTRIAGDIAVPESAISVLPLQISIDPSIGWGGQSCGWCDPDLVHYYSTQKTMSNTRLNFVREVLTSENHACQHALSGRDTATQAHPTAANLARKASLFLGPSNHASKKLNMRLV